jgi:nicotinate-nucleotide--dimethylbenzimidazole phosphoribosyltransferase
MMTGAMTAAATAGRIIVVDGFISTVAALAAIALNPQTRDCAVFAHCSAEPGHKALLDHLGVRPLLELEMRLGEGTGAALAIPLVRAAELMLRDMADLPGEHPA